MRNIDLTDKRIIISRTDSIGDVMLTLPLCAWIKNNFKGVHVIFLGSLYTKPVINCYSSVDEFIDWKEIENLPTSHKIESFRNLKADIIVHVFPRKEIASLAKKAKIQYRIGTSHRTFHFLTCSHRINITRKKSILHESQLNFELLRPFGLTEIPSLEELNQITCNFIAPKAELPEFIIKKLNTNKDKNVILHPKSQGSAVEWGLENYRSLSLKLEKLGYTVFFTGTEKEGEQYRSSIHFNDHIIDTSGKLTLNQLIVLISTCGSLIACSTGPLHIAGYLNCKAIGLYSPKKPIHPGRWRPLGSNVEILVNDENCEVCKKRKPCNCIEKISVERVLELIV
jgi:ADP-heptose:LPS heptosyltransferase